MYVQPDVFPRRADIETEERVVGEERNSVGTGAKEDGAMVAGIRPEISSAVTHPYRSSPFVLPSCFTLMLVIYLLRLWLCKEKRIVLQARSRECLMPTLDAAIHSCSGIISSKNRLKAMQNVLRWLESSLAYAV